MRERTCAEVDVAAVHRVAARLDAAAELVDVAVREHLGRLTFGGAVAGRAYTARGDALRAALRRLATEMSRWSRASTDVALALRATADRYVDAELHAAQRIA